MPLVFQVYPVSNGLSSYGTNTTNVSFLSFNLLFICSTAFFFIQSSQSSQSLTLSISHSHSVILWIFQSSHSDRSFVSLLPRSFLLQLHCHHSQQLYEFSGIHPLTQVLIYLSCSLLLVCTTPTRQMCLKKSLHDQLIRSIQVPKLVDQLFDLAPWLELESHVVSFDQNHLGFWQNLYIVLNRILLAVVEQGNKHSLAQTQFPGF